MNATRDLSWQMIGAACNRALRGWPMSVAPCVGYIESDYAPGTFYPCATCNPNWSRIPEPRRLSPEAATNLQRK